MLGGDDNVVEGNFIGTNRGGTASLPNGRAGIALGVRFGGRRRFRARVAQPDFREPDRHRAIGRSVHDPGKFHRDRRRRRCSDPERRPRHGDRGRRQRRRRRRCRRGQRDFRKRRRRTPARGRHPHVGRRQSHRHGRNGNRATRKQLLGDQLRVRRGEPDGQQDRRPPAGRAQHHRVQRLGRYCPLRRRAAHLHPAQPHLSQSRDQRAVGPRDRPRPRQRDPQRRRRRRHRRQRPAELSPHPLGRARTGDDPRVQATLRGAPDQTFAVEFFWSACNFRPRDFLQGENYLGAGFLSHGRQRVRRDRHHATPSRSRPARLCPRPRPTRTTTPPSSPSRSSSPSRPPRARPSAARPYRSRARTSTPPSPSRSAVCPRRNVVRVSDVADHGRCAGAAAGLAQRRRRDESRHDDGNAAQGLGRRFPGRARRSPVPRQRDPARFQRRDRRLRSRPLLRRQPHDALADGGVPHPGAARILLHAPAGDRHRVPATCPRRTSTPPGSRSSSARA